jgi:hypothetical protein
MSWGPAVHHPLTGVILSFQEGSFAMSSEGLRERNSKVKLSVPSSFRDDGVSNNDGYTETFGEEIQITESISHRFNRSLGHYDAGGPFYTSRSRPFLKPSVVKDVVVGTGLHDTLYSGPILPEDISGSELAASGYSGALGARETDSMNAKGATAVSLSAPTNPASDLGVTLAESFREGVPSLIGIKSWRNRASAAKAAGSEYLNYQFGWAPLVDEIGKVVHTARYHRDLLTQYHAGEGRDTHRTFRFPLQSTHAYQNPSGRWPLAIGINNTSINSEVPAPSRRISMVTESKVWFEGSFTYGLPSSSDSWKRAIGFGSDADALYGLALDPEILWELTPWSWAVDWFTNTGDVISNVRNFGLAGLVMRYGYVMMETIERVTVECDGPSLIVRKNPGGSPKEYDRVQFGPCFRGYEVITKRRVAANPFGFGLTVEGLSPTQLAIAAALGLTLL